MRYLLLSVLVVFLVAIVMIPSAIQLAYAVFGCPEGDRMVCLERNPNGTCKSGMCSSAYQSASAKQAEEQTLLLVIQFVIILAIVVTIIIVVIRLIRKSRRRDIRPIEKDSNKRKRNNAYVVLFLFQAHFLF